MAANRLLDQPHDHHQHATPDPSGGDLANNRTDIEGYRSSGGARRGAADKRTDNLRPDAPADYSDDRVTDGPEVVSLE